MPKSKKQKRTDAARAAKGTGKRVEEHDSMDEVEVEGDAAHARETENAEERRQETEEEDEAGEVGEDDDGLLSSQTTAVSSPQTRLQ